MKADGAFFRVPEWALGDLVRVGQAIREGLPPSLKAQQKDGDILLPSGGGDPLRPYLVLLAARCLGSSGERVIRLAAGIQMIHLAALLHDRLGAAQGDIAPSAGRGEAMGPHRKESMDILLGDFMFSTAACIIIEDGDERIVRDMIATSVASAEAQASLVSLKKDPGAYGPWPCFEIVAEKQSLLLSLSLRAGAFVGNAAEADREALSDFGALYGKALRIVQDLACWETGDEAGPRPVGPVRYHHPLLLLWEREGMEAWRDAVGNLPDTGTGPLGGLRARLDGSGYLRASLGWARRYGEKALRRLEPRPGLRGNSELDALVRDLQRPEHGRFGKGFACVQ